MITPAQLAYIQQAIAHLLGQMPMNNGPAQQMPLSTPTPTEGPSRTALAHTSMPMPAVAQRTPITAQTRGVSHGARAASGAHGSRAVTRIEPVPTSASAAYMSLARKLPASGIGSHDMNWGNMTHGRGAGNFGMK